jgi:hypothetical protein
MNTMHAHRAGPAAPESNEARTPASDPSLDSILNERRGSTWRDTVAQQNKRISTAVARGACAGFAVHTVAGQLGQVEFLVTRWNLSRAFTDIAAVERFLDQVGAP